MVRKALYMKRNLVTNHQLEKIFQKMALARFLLQIATRRHLLEKEKNQQFDPFQT